MQKHVDFSWGHTKKIIAFYSPWRARLASGLGSGSGLGLASKEVPRRPPSLPRKDRGSEPSGRGVSFAADADAGAGEGGRLLWAGEGGRFAGEGGRSAMGVDRNLHGLHLARLRLSVQNK